MSRGRWGGWWLGHLTARLTYGVLGEEEEEEELRRIEMTKAGWVEQDSHSLGHGMSPGGLCVCVDGRGRRVFSKELVPPGHS